MVLVLAPVPVGRAASCGRLPAFQPPRAVRFDAVSTFVSYTGGYLGSSTYEGRSELRYAP